MGDQGEILPAAVPDSSKLACGPFSHMFYAVRNDNSAGKVIAYQGLHKDEKEWIRK